MQSGFLISRKLLYFRSPAPKRRLVRVVEGARLESVYTRKGIKGSNPLVSAKGDKQGKTLFVPFFFPPEEFFAASAIEAKKFTFSVRNASYLFE
jgi:hypothetical protein